MAKKKEENVEETKTDEKAETSIVEEVVEAATDVVEDVVEAVSETASDVVEAVSDVIETATGSDNDDDKTTKKRRKRTEKVGIVQSDKMTKTVVVRVDRLVKHQMYRKYVKRKKKFMAHDELGATTGDKVRIVETRPTSAKKRWRVVEIVQKAQK